MRLSPGRIGNEERLATTPETELEEPAKLPSGRAQFDSFEAAIRSKLQNYPLLTVGLEPGKLSFAPFRLNVSPLRWDKEYYDAVRFTTPAQTNLDRIWAFTLFYRQFSWRIMNEDFSKFDSPNDRQQRPRGSRSLILVGPDREHLA